MKRPDFYRLLHVQRDAPTAVIKASHRTLMQSLRMHPDLGGDHAQAVLLNEALATLSDPKLRAAYDRSLAPMAEPVATAASPPSDVRRERHERHACPFCASPAPVGSADRADSECHACGSALFPAKRHRMGETSRRTLARLPRSMPMTFRRSTSREAILMGTTEDISLNGARFAAQADVRVGECLSLDCEFCSAVAMVKSVRHDSGHRHVGVEFLTLRLKRARGGLVSSVA